MWAMQVDAPGAAGRITRREIPIPNPRAGEVLVRFIASAVNHVDTFVRSGKYSTDLPLPFTVGRDLVGEVFRSGSPNFEPGDLVWTNSMGYDGRQGTLSEYVCVPSSRLFELPPGVSPQFAASVLHGASTAAIGLGQEARLRSGELLFVGGGAGSVGSAALQIAVQRGARVVTTCSQVDIPWCIERGASAAFDYGDPALWDMVAKEVGAGAHVWWDQSGRDDLRITMPLVRVGGVILVTAGIGATTELPVSLLYTRNLSLRGFAISNASTVALQEAAKWVNELLRSKTLMTRRSQSLPVFAAARAHSLLESGKADGKIVLVDGG